jgi:hypothetical protein
MAQQYDLQTAFDPTTLTQINQLQLLQLVNSLTPLDNIGGVIAQATAPDVVNNPRFSRYIWLDTSTVPASRKVYNPDTVAWVVDTITINSVVEASISDGTVSIAKLKADETKPAYIFRFNNAGVVEAVPLSTILEGSTVMNLLQNITNVPGSNGQKVLLWNGATLSFADPEISLEDLIASGNENQVLSTVAGALSWEDVIDLIAANSLPIAKIAKGTAGYALRTKEDSSAIEEYLPLISKEYTTTTADLNATGANYRYAEIAHGLTTVKQVIARLKCTTADGTYTVGDEVPIECVDAWEAGMNHKPFTIVVTASGVIRICVVNNDIAFQISTMADPPAKFSIDKADWAIKLYVLGN